MRGGKALMIVAALLAAGPTWAADPSPLVRRFGDNRFRVTGWPIGSALSPDGSRLAVLSAVGNDRVVLLVLDAVTGRHVSRATVETHGHFAPPGLAFSPDGKYIAAAVAPEVHVVWAADTGRLVLKLPLGERWSSLCRFTPDGRLVVTGEKATDLYDLPSGKVVGTWPAGDVARLTTDAKTFARIDFPTWTVSLGDPATGAVAGTLPVTMPKDASGSGLAFSADGTKLAVVPDRTKLQIWDVATRRKDAEAEIPAAAVDKNDPYYVVRFAPDGRTVALETKRGAIYRWDARTLAPLPRLDAPWALYVRGVHWSKDGRTILAVADNGLVNRWDAATGKPLPADGYIRRVHFGLTADGSQLAVGDHAGRIDVYDVATGRLVRQLAPGGGPAGQLMCLAVSPEGTRMVTGHRDGGVRLLRLADGQDAPLVPADAGSWFDYLGWAPDGSAVYAADGEKVARLAVPGGRPVWTFPAGRAALSPDGRSVVHVNGNEVTVLDAATGRPGRSFAVTPPRYANGLSGLVRPVVFAPDGRRLAAALGDVVAILDPAGRELRRFVAADPVPPPDFNAQRMGALQEPHLVEALTFTPDGHWLVSGSQDRAVKVWEVATGRLVARFDGSDSPIEQVAVASDGRTAFAAGSDGFVAQWDLTPRAIAGRSPEELWAAAADPDPTVAVPAAWALATGPAAREFLAGKLPPAEATAAGQVDQWLKDLDAPGFAAREAAERALAARGRLIEARLRELAKSPPSPEARRRAEALLARLDEAYPPADLRALRVVQACERAGHRELLARWAGGAAGAVLTEDAKAALARRSPTAAPAR
ncbi:MAG TPA: hypothetical protein VGF55_27820 [Gemmataceae bacterium]|jgi:WD40 repeat protein